MGSKSINLNSELGKIIKMRRNELGLTIEDAAQRAGVGKNTWIRYESGESIRQDKSEGVCKALNWSSFPTIEIEETDTIDLDEYHNHEAWSQYISDTFGEVAAVSFAIGSDIILDHIKEDMRELSTMPKGTHIGQLSASFIAYLMPEQFLMNYDYEFLYLVKTKIIYLRTLAKTRQPIVAHSVLDELLLYLMMEESQFLLESDSSLCEEGWNDWVFDMFNDADIISFLYSDRYLTDENPFHFEHWTKEQFYCYTE